MPCIVGIDVGDSRIGLAISDSSKTIAFPLGVIERVGGSFGFNKLEKLLSDRDVDSFVVGMPLRSDGSVGPQAEKVLKYAEELGKRFLRAVHTWDERFTTVIAQGYLREGNLSPGKRRQVVDEIAAQIILQSYLDSLKTSA